MDGWTVRSIGMCIYLRMRKHRKCSIKMNLMGLLVRSFVQSQVTVYGSLPFISHQRDFLPLSPCVCVCVSFIFLFNCFLFRLFEWIRWSPLTVLKNVTMVTNVHLCLAYETSWTYTHFSDPFIRPIYAFVRMQAIRSCFHSLDYYSHTYTLTPRHSLTHLSAATCVHVRLHFTFSLFSNFHHSTSEIQSISV